MRHSRMRDGERGTILVTVILFIAVAIAGLAAISSSRVVTETEHQKTLEEETRAYHEAYAQLQLALNVVNSSAYTDENKNIELRNSMEGDYGGTVSTTTVTTTVTYTTELGTDGEWLRDPEGILHGKIKGTDVRVYNGRDYIQRLSALKGRVLSAVDPDAKSQSYFVLEATGRSGDTATNAAYDSRSQSVPLRASGRSPFIAHSPGRPPPVVPPRPPRGAAAAR